METKGAKNKSREKARTRAEAGVQVEAHSIAIPDGVSCTISESSIFGECSGNKLQKKFNFGNLKPSVEGKNISVRFDKYTKREKTLFGTFEAALKVMFEGLKSPFVYKL